jgi:membrane protease YdiL (CAAX protease family)
VDERAALLGTAAVVGALALVNVAKHARKPGEVSLSVAAAAALLAYAGRSGLSWGQLGLGRGQVRSGAVWAGAAVLAVAAAYGIGVLHPATRSAFLDERYQLEPREALRTAFVVIPLGTVLLEEVAFRSVLWGMLERHSTQKGVVLASSALFGLWHVLPSLDFASANQGLDQGASQRVAKTALVTLGTVTFTALGGLTAGELRRRSGSVLASAGMHWATNGLGVLFGVVARRLGARQPG